MKIGIVSDTHMINSNIDLAIPYLKKCDLILHAGDNFEDSKYIHKETKVDIIAVKGNCDFEHVEDEILFEIENKNIFLTHGHKYNVNFGIEELQQKAQNVDADIVVFGHTHIPLNIEKNGVLYLNPGSISLPRQKSQEKTFLILQIEEGKCCVKEVIL